MQVSNIKNQRINTQFKAGLTKRMLAEINHCDPILISKEISKYGVPSDFKNDKMLAWCSLKCVEIISNINKKFHLNLALPKGIFVEDFSNIKDLKEDSLAFCNITRERLYKNSKKQVAPRTILINKEIDKKTSWVSLDQLADENYENGRAATDYFLDIFLHEFIHSAHINNVIKRRSQYSAIISMLDSIEEKYLLKFDKKLGQIIFDNICSYATDNPMEAVACDLARRIINSIDKNNITVEKNPLKNSPYLRKNIFRFIDMKEADKSKILNKYLTNFWNGRFEL